MSDINYYGQPIIDPAEFMGPHRPIVPAAGGLPPFCTCGWTRWHDEEHDRWFELSDHLADMGEYVDGIDVA